MGLCRKWVSSSISLQTICIALGSEKFLSGEKVYRKKKRTVNVLGYEFKYITLLTEFQYFTEQGRASLQEYLWEMRSKMAVW